MKHDEFLRELDEARLIEVIRRVETQTSGEVRLCVTRTPEPDPLGAARRAFTALGIDRTAKRNGVLILIAPASQTFAVVGDEGIHGRCGDAFWTELARDLGLAFGEGKAEDGLETAIHRIGDALAKHFPPEPGNQNELPDGIATV